MLFSRKGWLWVGVQFIFLGIIGLVLGEALVIVQPTKCGVRRLVAAFRTMRRQVAALRKLIHRAER